MCPFHHQQQDVGSPGSQGILTSPSTQGEKSLPHTMHLSLRIRFPFCWWQTSELTQLCTLARLDQGSPRTVSCAKPQTPTSGNFCTGQVSYPYGPVHHIPGKTVSEVGYKRRKKRTIQPTEISPLLLFIYQNFMQALSRACLRYWFETKGRSDSRCGCDSSLGSREKGWSEPALSTEKILELVFSKMVREYFRI